MSTLGFLAQIMLIHRFKADANIEYNGFKAVYNFIPNPLETEPFIPKCEFEVGGSTGFLGRSAIFT